MGRVARWMSAFVILGFAVAACAPNDGASTESAPSTTDRIITAIPTTIPTTTPATGATVVEGSIAFGSCRAFVDEGARPPHDGWTCGLLAVPLDRDDSDAPTLELAVTRRVGADSGGRSIVVNPGGPGSAGLPFVWALADDLPPELLDRRDIVSWDPRGVGRSTPAITCPAGARFGDVDLLPRCSDTTGALMTHLSTRHHVDDLEALRQALDAERLDYVGFSYGTLLGAMYAGEYPDRVGRFVLDGAVDPDSGTANGPSIDGRPWYADPGLPDVRRRFFELCDATVECALGLDSERAVMQLAGDVRDLPADGHTPGARVDPVSFDVAVSSAVVDPADWLLLRVALEDAASGDASAFAALVDRLGLGDTGFDDAVDRRSGDETLGNMVISCADFGAAFPGLDECTGLPLDHLSGHELGAVELREPVLVIGTEFDPNTPVRHVHDLAGRLGDAATLVWSGVGHLAFPSNSACVDAVVVDYLLDGVVPETGTTCPFVPGLVDDAAVGAWWFTLPRGEERAWLLDRLPATLDAPAPCLATALARTDERTAVHAVLGVDHPDTAETIAEAVAACRSEG